MKPIRFVPVDLSDLLVRVKLNKRFIYWEVGLVSCIRGLVITSFSSENFITAQQPDSGRSLQVSVSSLYNHRRVFGKFQNKLQKQWVQSL